MIKDLTAGFKQALQQFPALVLDNYKMKDGLYIRIHVHQSWEGQSGMFDHNHLIMNSKEEVAQPNPDLLQWFKCRDYWSSLVDMNKSVDPKKQIHSNNPFALFAKEDVFQGKKQDAKTDMTENIQRFMQAAAAEQVKQKWLELAPIPKEKIIKQKVAKEGVSTADVQSPFTANNSGAGQADELAYFRESEYVYALNYLESLSRQEWMDGITQWYHDNLLQLTDFIKQLTFKNYVKLFFILESPTSAHPYTCEQLYEFEYILYTIPKIYNSNDYNQIVNQQLVGLPSLDMTMNSKKPFLEHKTMRIVAPDRVSLEQALLAKKSAEWLATARPKYTTHKLGYDTGIIPGATSTLEGTFHIYMDGKDNELHGFENVPFPPQTAIHLEWDNFLQLKEKDKDNEPDMKFYPAIDDVELLQKTISSRFFRGRMNGQFVMNDAPDVKNKEFTGVMVALFMQSRQAFHDWLYKGTSLSLRPLFANVTRRLLEEQLVHVETSRLQDLADAFNLRLSIDIELNGVGGREMADRILEMVDILRDKLTGDGLASCANDDEFYFTAGQLAYYLISRSGAQKKTGELVEPFLRARNGQQMKKRLEEVYMLYKHEVQLNHRKFNRALSMVMGYIPDMGNEGDSRELLLAGLFADNLMYEKSAKGVDGND